MSYTILGNSTAPAEMFAGNVLGAFARALCDKMDRAVSTVTGRNSTACYAIVQIGSEPGLSIEMLRRMLSLEHSSVVRMLDRLEEAGLVRRVRKANDDQRKVQIHLTDDGEWEFTKILDARREVLDRVVAKIDEKEKTFLLALIKKLMPEVVDRGDDQHYVCRLCDLEVCPQQSCPVNLAYPENVEIPDKPFRRKMHGGS